MSQYDKIAIKYTEIVKNDPQKKFVQYSEALRLLSDIEGKLILDVGCGSGAFTNLLKKKDAKVVGYDNSHGQIMEALREHGHNIKFIVSTPQKFKSKKKFDKAVSVLVLHYSVNKEELKSFFSSTFNSLKVGAEFVCILCNPNFQRCGQELYNRVFKRLEKGRMRVDFIDLDQEVKCSAEYSDFSCLDYERAVIGGGFKRFEWVNLKIDPSGIEEMGEEYWQGFEEDCPYIGFIAYK